MAKRGTGFFDSRGNFFRNADEATVSDIASLLGQIGDGESLAPGIAHLLLEKRHELEDLFSEHDAMMDEVGERGNVTTISKKVAKLPS